MSKYIFYPGCSMEGSAKAYYDSLMQIAEPLGMKLQEIDDWNCCGATEYVGLNLVPAYSLIARNLALAAQQKNGTNTVMAPCSACYLNLAKADYYMSERPALGEKVNEALEAGGLHYDPGSMEIRHLLDVIYNEIGIENLKAKVVKPLTGLRVAPYLGCMVPRPDYNHRWSDHEHPVELVEILQAIGAEVVDFPLATTCCGGHMTQIGPETAFELINRLVSSASKHEADIMTTVCPMCQMNLDAYQSEANRHFGTSHHMPIVFFTQLIGLALGMDPEKLGFGMELTSAKEALGKIGTEVKHVAAPKAPRKKGEGLPMPPRLLKNAQKQKVEVEK